LGRGQPQEPPQGVNKKALGHIIASVRAVWVKTEGTMSQRIALEQKEDAKDIIEISKYSVGNGYPDIRMEGERYSLEWTTETQKRD